MLRVDEAEETEAGYRDQGENKGGPAQDTFPHITLTPIMATLLPTVLNRLLHFSQHPQRRRKGLQDGTPRRDLIGTEYGRKCIRRFGDNCETLLFISGLVTVVCPFD